MNGPVFATTVEGRRDAGVHKPLLGAVNFTKSKVFPLTVKRGEGLGLTAEQIKKLLGK